MKVIGAQKFYLSYDMIPFTFPKWFQQELTNKNVIVTKNDFIELRTINDPSYLTYDCLKSIVLKCTLIGTSDDRRYCARMMFITPCGRELFLKNRWPAQDCPDMQDKIVTIQRSDYLEIVYK